MLVCTRRVSRMNKKKEKVRIRYVRTIELSIGRKIATAESSIKLNYFSLNIVQFFVRPPNARGRSVLRPPREEARQLVFHTSFYTRAHILNSARVIAVRSLSSSTGICIPTASELRSVSSMIHFPRAFLSLFSSFLWGMALHSGDVCNCQNDWVA